MKPLVGREEETSILQQLLSSKQAEFIALYGRRRVGKTYLVQQYCTKQGIYLECTGIKDGKLSEQLINFIKSFAATFYPGLALNKPKSWRDAFELLTTEIKKIPSSQKVIIFLDELPWLAKRKSLLLQSLDYFWNTQWNKLPNFKLIVCGSAASWMLEHLINAKGGLHNRITKSILLEPFTLGETKQFLINRGIKFTEKQVLDIYMVMGGVPFYLAQLQKSKSIAQNIQEICFKKDGLLFNEFPRLFKALFDKAELNLRIVREIAKLRYGISFTELANRVNQKVGGRFKTRLDELEAAGFIQSFLPYGRKKRDRYYRIIDEYTLFYLKWIEEIAINKSMPRGNNYWIGIAKSPSWQSWSGYTFEMICYKHADKIIHALKLNNISCLINHWRYIPKQQEPGAQIDLLLDRDDNAITLCEIKYSKEPYVIDKSYAQILLNKIEVLQKNIQANKQIFVIFITASGLKTNAWSQELINDVVELKMLF
jgi:uncharacterized protein